MLHRYNVHVPVVRKDLLLHLPQLPRLLPRVTGKTGRGSEQDSAGPIRSDRSSSVLLSRGVHRDREQKSVHRDRDQEIGHLSVIRAWPGSTGAPTTGHCQVGFDVQGLQGHPQG